MVAPLVGLGGSRARGGRALLARAALMINDPMRDRGVAACADAVCVVEAAVLVAVVVEPDLVGYEPSPWVRRLCVGRHQYRE